MNLKSFGGKQINNSTTMIWIIAIVLMLSVTFGLTLAFFVNQDQASGLAKMSGAVRIEAVGKYNEDSTEPNISDRYDSIEDTNTTKLVIELEDDYPYLIPGMNMNIQANCRVYMSTTKPLLRAKIDMSLKNMSTGDVGEEDLILSDIYGQFLDVISPTSQASKDWHLHTDGYFYYIGDAEQPANALSGELVLEEIDATASDQVIHFIDEPIQFPEFVDSTYSGFGVTIKITFQAIQNYIPDENGLQVANTIDNSQKIFESFDYDITVPSNLSYFDITTEGGKKVLNLKSGVILPDTLLLPSVDENDNEISVIGASFQGASNVRTLIVPSTYTTIQEAAFRTSTITSVDLSKSNITSIPKQAFFGSNVSSIKLPAVLQSIGESAFESSKVGGVIFPETLTSIGVNAFKMSSMSTLYIPKNVSSIGSGAFMLCSKLSKIEVVDTNNYFKDLNNIALVSKDGKNYKVLASQNNLGTSYSIPEGTETLDSYSLYYATNISTLSLPSTLKSFGESTFSKLLATVNIASGNTTFSMVDDIYLVGGNTLYYVYPKIDVETYVLPVNITTANSGCFDTKNVKYIKEIEIGANLSNGSGFIGASYLEVEKFTVSSDNANFTVVDNILMSKNLKTAYRYATLDYKRETITVPNNCEIISDSAFANAKDLESVTIPNTVKTISSLAFYNCTNLTNISIPSSVTSIGNEFAKNTAIESITVYGNLDKGVFNGCSQLKYLTLGNNVSSIAEDMCLNCSSLVWVEFTTTTPPSFLSSRLFEGAKDDFKIYVPSSAVNTYKTANNFTENATRIYSVTSR